MTALVTFLTHLAFVRGRPVCLLASKPPHATPLCLQQEAVVSDPGSFKDSAIALKVVEQNRGTLCVYTISTLFPTHWFKQYKKKEPSRHGIEAALRKLEPHTYGRGRLTCNRLLISS